LKVLTICYKQYQTDDMAMQKGFVCTSRGDSPMRGCFTPHRRRALPVRGGSRSAEATGKVLRCGFKERTCARHTNLL
jgi:hypothetical protein